MSEEVAKTAGTDSRGVDELAKPTDGSTPGVSGAAICEDCGS